MYLRYFLFTITTIFMAMVISSAIAINTNITTAVGSCEINVELYRKYLGWKGINEVKHTESKYAKKCTQPGCFYIFKQKNLWKKWAPSLFTRGTKDQDETIMGCRYDIPYLIQRTHGAADRSLHKILEMLRACFIRNTTEHESAADRERHSFCQPEYYSNTTTSKPTTKTTSSTSINEIKAKFSRVGHHYDTWVDRHLPSVQEKCFYNFANGIFFVKSGKRNLIVCCDDGSEMKGGIGFRHKCEELTQEIDLKQWRNKDG